MSSVAREGLVVNQHAFNVVGVMGRNGEVEDARGAVMAFDVADGGVSAKGRNVVAGVELAGRAPAIGGGNGMFRGDGQFGSVGKQNGEMRRGDVGLSGGYRCDAQGTVCCLAEDTLADLHVFHFQVAVGGGNVLAFHNAPSGLGDQLHPSPGQSGDAQHDHGDTRNDDFTRSITSIHKEEQAANTKQGDCADPNHLGNEVPFGERSEESEQNSNSSHGEQHGAKAELTRIGR